MMEEYTPAAVPSEAKLVSNPDGLAEIESVSAQNEQQWPEDSPFAVRNQSLRIAQHRWEEPQ